VPFCAFCGQIHDVHNLSAGIQNFIRQLKLVPFATVRFNRPVVYVRDKEITVSFKLGNHAISDITHTDVNVSYPLTDYNIRVVGEYRGDSMTPTNNLIANGGPYEMTSQAKLPERVGYDVEEITFRFQYHDTDADVWLDIPGKQTTSHLVYRLAAAPTDFAKQQGAGDLYLKIVDFTCDWAKDTTTPEEVFAEIWNGSNFWTPFQGNPLEPDRDSDNAFIGKGDPVESARQDAWNKAPMAYTFRHNLGPGQTVNNWLDHNYARCGGWVPVLRTFAGTHGLDTEEKRIPPMRWRFVDGASGDVLFVNYADALDLKNNNKRPGGEDAEVGDTWYRPYGIWVNAHGQANPYTNDPVWNPNPPLMQVGGSNKLVSFWELYYPPFSNIPESTDHVLLKYNGRYYDPSYEHTGGISYASINQWADASISYYYYHRKFTSDAHGVYQDTTLSMDIKGIWLLNDWHELRAVRFAQAIDKDEIGLP